MLLCTYLNAALTKSEAMVMDGLMGGVTLNTSEGGMNCVENLGGKKGEMEHMDYK